MKLYNHTSYPTRLFGEMVEEAANVVDLTRSEVGDIDIKFTSTPFHSEYQGTFSPDSSCPGGVISVCVGYHLESIKEYLSDTYNTIVHEMSHAADYRHSFLRDESSVSYRSRSYEMRARSVAERATLNLDNETTDRWLGILQEAKRKEQERNQKEVERRRRAEEQRIKRERIQRLEERERREEKRVREWSQSLLYRHETEGMELVVDGINGRIHWSKQDDGKYVINHHPSGKGSDDRIHRREAGYGGMRSGLGKMVLTEAENCGILKKVKRKKRVRKHEIAGYFLLVYSLIFPPVILALVGYKSAFAAFALLSCILILVHAYRPLDNEEGEKQRKVEETKKKPRKSQEQIEKEWQGELREVQQNRCTTGMAIIGQDGYQGVEDTERKETDHQRTYIRPSTTQSDSNGTDEKPLLTAFLTMIMLAGIIIVVITSYLTEHQSLASEQPNIKTPQVQEPQKSPKEEIVRDTKEEHQYGSYGYSRYVDVPIDRHMIYKAINKALRLEREKKWRAARTVWTRVWDMDVESEIDVVLTTGFDYRKHRTKCLVQANNWQTEEKEKQTEKKYSRKKRRPKCTNCRDKIYSFHDQASYEEYSTSGLCQSCQDDASKEGGWARLTEDR